MSHQLDIIQNILSIVSRDQILLDCNQKKSYETDWRKQLIGSSIAVVFPTSVNQIQQIVILCNQQNVKIIPQGGNTSLCGASIPRVDSFNQEQFIIINLSKLNKIIALDQTNKSIICEAGVTLIAIQQHAEQHNLYFPLDITPRNVCQIGGLVATNAGGMHVIKYGNMRDLVLGIEAILPNGEIVNQCHSLYKNNCGLDLKQLFIATEGIFGIITKVSLKLFILPKRRIPLIFGVQDKIDNIIDNNIADQSILKQDHSISLAIQSNNAISQAISFVDKIKRYGYQVSMFELISNDSMQLFNIAKNNYNANFSHEVHELANQYIQYPWVIIVEIEFNNLPIDNKNKDNPYNGYNNQDIYAANHNYHNNISSCINSIDHLQDIMIDQFQNTINSNDSDGESNISSNDSDSSSGNDINNNSKCYNLIDFNSVFIGISTKEASMVYSIRELIPQLEKIVHKLVAKHDISIPISKIATFLTYNRCKIKQEFANCDFSIFGHLGDGNLHYNVVHERHNHLNLSSINNNSNNPELTNLLYNSHNNQLDKEAKTRLIDKTNQIVYLDVLALGGSISAEHGIGAIKKRWLSYSIDQATYDTAYKIKQILDPNNIMNPYIIY